MLIDILQQGNMIVAQELGLHIGHDGHGMDLADGQLALDIKCADTFYFITKKLDAVRQIIGEGEDVHDPSTNGKLPWFVDKIDPFKIVFVQKLIDKINVYLRVF